MELAAKEVEPKNARVKVHIGVSRSQPSRQIESLLSDEAEGLEKNVYSTNTALVDFCSSSYLRNKRRLNPDVTKVLTIDSDYKLKKPPTPSPHHVFNSTGATNTTEVGPIGPRVEIINGQIVLKESSLVIANQDSVLVEGEYEEIEEGIHASSRYSSFLTKRKSKSWSIEETRQFYKVLQQCGTEFSVMETFFPERTRKELKLKFFREESHHPELIKRALDSSAPLELQPFETKFGELVEPVKKDSEGAVAGVETEEGLVGQMSS